MDGLLLRLRKKKQNISSVGVPDSGFFVFGYYDVLEVSKVTEWEAFSPGFQATDSKSMIDYSHEILTKLVVPPSADELEREHKPFISFAQSDEDMENDAALERPLLTVTFLRFTKNQIAHSNGFLSLVEDTNRKIAESVSMPDDGVNPLFAVYPTIGFMDAAVVCRSNNFTVASKAISDLREIPDFLYTSYIVPCVSARSENAFDRINDSDTKSLLTAALKAGFSAGDFISQCNEKFNADSAQKFGDIYETFGSMDVLALPDAPFSSLIPMYRKSGNGNLWGPPLDEILAVSDTSILIETPDVSDDKKQTQTEPNSVPEPDESPQGESNGTDEHSELETKFHDMLDKQNGYGGNSLITQRNIEGLRSMACFYFDITNSTHSFDIRHVMNPALQALIKIVDKTSTCEMRSGKWHEGFTPVKFNQSLTMFRDTFTDLMNDYARAERRMFECRWLKHPSTASNSKLILAYHLFLRDINKYFPDDSTYDFLTVSGGVDEVVTDCLFYYDKPDSSGAECRLIILRLPERALFNPSDTLFQLFHEYFHFKGERLREIRNGYILISLATYVYISFFEVLGDEDSNHSNDFIEIFSNFGRENTYKHKNEHEQLNSIKEKQRDTAKNLNVELIKGVYKLLNDALKKSPPQSEVYEHWEHAVSNILESTLPKLGVKLKKYFDKHRDIMLETVVNMKSNAGKSPDIWKTIDKIRKDTGCRKWLDKVDALYENSCEGLMNKLGDIGKETDIRNMLSYLGAAYKEAYADFCSALLLQSTRDEYMNSFVMRNWRQIDIESMETVLRIGGVLFAKFRDNKYNHSPTGDADFDNLMKDTKSGILSRIKQYAPVVAPLGYYLDECKKHYPDVDCNASKSMLDLYKQTKRSADGSALNIEYTNASGEIGVLNILLQKWAEASNEP